ncbi:MAG: hypothetical protein JXQ81_07925 [Desulfuromonadales bacterium]|nr:hypothetical protein [Desulfuromonadales bacterium]MBN2792416.1 hypothetical protein [Desulfuromonadales bacterium]
MEENQGKLSLEETASRMNTTKVNVLMHLKQGHIAGEEIDGEWVVAASSVKKFLAAGETFHTPVICQSSCRNRHCGSCS